MGIGAREGGWRSLLQEAGRPGLVAVAVVVAVLAPLAVHWLGGKTLAWFDTLRLHAPQRWIVDEALRAFRLPLWNPYLGGGTPLFADAVHGVLHPVSIAAAWLGGGRGIDLAIAAHVALAALGATVLARELGASRPAAATAGIAFGLSGYVLSMAGNVTFLAGAAGLPLCVAGLRRASIDRRPVALALGAASAALLAFTGDIQSVVVAGVLAAVLAWEAGGWRAALAAAAVGTLGLCLAGVQLVPATVHFAGSTRSLSEWSASPLAWALEPFRVPELVAPGILWGPDPLLDRVYEGLAGPGRWPAGNPAVPFAASVCLGLIPVTLALVGARDGRRGKILAALALALLWGALGTSLGADALLGRLPLWRAFQYPVKLSGPLGLVVALLAARGLDVVLARRVRGSRLVAGAAALAIASVVAGALANAFAGFAPEVAAEAASRVLRGGLHVGAAALALCCWVLARNRLGPRWEGPVLAVVAWCSAAAASPAALRPGSAEVRLRSPGPSLVAPPPGPRIVTPFTHEPDSLSPGTTDWIDQSAREHAALGYAAHNVRSRIDSLEEYGALPSRRLAALREAFDLRWPVVARRFAVTHVVADEPFTAPQATALALAADGGAAAGPAGMGGRAWAVPHREWASFASEVQVVAGEEAAPEALARSFMQGSERVVLEGGGSFEVAPGRVLSLDRGLERLRVEAEADGEGTLVVADAWWPGWEAWIDGEPTPIFPADALVRAVRWPAGRHLLEMRYRPWEVRAGLLVSIAGLLLLGAACAWLARREPR